jgi:methyl-accepting chemotaxis protein
MPRIGIRYKIMGMAMGGAVLASIILVTVGAWQSNVFGDQAEAEVSKLMDADLDHITEGVYNLVKAQDEAVQLKVNHDLNVARHLLQNKGAVALSDDTMTWTAVNQYTQEAVEVELPMMLVGGTWLGPNTDLNTETPVVDEVKGLVGGTATIFQRMNEEGDILRVATNVEKLDSTRAIGTYIPAVNPDGTPNPVVSTVMQGKTYRGIAYVVNAWYITAYEPIFDQQGEIIGVLYVGVKQENIESLRQAILQTRVGETGYVYVLGGKGDDRGHYIISKNGEQDGLDIWEARDTEGRLFIQSIVEKAISLEPGQFATERYPWRNPGEPKPRWKVARIAYYEPWDWVIGVGAYEEEFEEIHAQLQASRSRMIGIFAVAGFCLVALGGATAWVIARGISAPLSLVTQAVTKLAEDSLPGLIASIQAVADGDLSTTICLETDSIEVRSGDELEDMAHAFNGMNGALDTAGAALGQMVANLRDLVGQVVAGAQSVGVSADELSSAADQAAQSALQVAAAIQQVARGAAHQNESVAQATGAVAQVTSMIDGVARGAHEQSTAVIQSTEITTRISGAVEQVVASAQRMENVRKTVEMASQKVHEMGERSRQIVAITNLLDEIAGQTNILALNAAVEAAKAKEHGQSFAVVANEVRRLARNSGAGTQEIAALIRAVQRTVAEAIAAMEESALQVNRQVADISTVTQQMSASTSKLVNAANAVSAVVEENIAATEEMSAGAGKVTQAMKEISAISEENNAASEEMNVSVELMNTMAEQVTVSARSLAGMAQHLEASVAQFKLPDGRVDEETRL